MRNEGVLKKWFGLCENAWFPWQSIVDLRMGVCLQKYSYISCYLSLSTKLIFFEDTFVSHPGGPNEQFDTHEKMSWGYKVT